MPYQEYIGLFDRVVDLLDLVKRMPDKLSDEETEGLLKFLPPDTSNSIGGILSPRFRDASIGFLKMIADWLISAREAEENGKKVIIVPFNFPVEIIRAFDNALPITSEVLSTLGVVALEGQGERYWDMAMGLGLPDHMCSSNTIELGSMLGSEDFKPQAIVSSAPGGCDVNAKIHEFVSHYLGIPMFFLPKIPDNSKAGHEQYNLYMRRLISQLEEFLDEEMTEEKMRRVLDKANRCTELHYDLWDLQKIKPCPVPNIFSFFLYGTRFTMWGTDEAIKAMEGMVALCEQNAKDKVYPAKKERARCVWAYTSYYYDVPNFFNWMEEHGISHLGDGLDLYFPEPVDTTNMDTMIEGLARTAWNMPMTRQVGGESMSQQWTDDVIYAAKDLDADCVIYCGHHSCKQTWSVVSILRSELEKRAGLPLLVLQGDSWLKEMTPMSVIQDQVQQFVSNVVEKKTSKRRKVRRRKPKASSLPKKQNEA